MALTWRRETWARAPFSHAQTFAWQDALWNIRRNVSVEVRGREVANLTFAAPLPADPFALPPASAVPESHHAIRPSDIVLKEAAPHLFTVDFTAADMQTRVTVAEFADYLLVFRARTTRRSAINSYPFWKKFSNPSVPLRPAIHGQHRRVRSYVHAGATILVPPGTDALVRQMVVAPHCCVRPACWGSKPHAEVVEDRRPRMTPPPQRYTA